MKMTMGQNVEMGVGVESSAEAEQCLGRGVQVTEGPLQWKRTKTIKRKKG
jgi:hypothetical protein